MNSERGCSCVPSSVCTVYIYQLSHYQAVLLSCYHASIPLISQCPSFPFLICRTSPLTHQQCLLQLVLLLNGCLTLALYSPSLASSLLSSPILEKSEYCQLLVYVKAILNMCTDAYTCQYIIIYVVAPVVMKQKVFGDSIYVTALLQCRFVFSEHHTMQWR